MIKRRKSKPLPRSTKHAKRAPRRSADRRSTDSRKAPLARGRRETDNKDRPATTGKSGYRAKVRMYRQGLGDFFLVTLPRADGSEYRMLIDCGVIVGTPNATTTIQAMVKDLGDTVGNALDVIVVTHRHADHVSGFHQAEALFRRFKVGEVWVSWVENPGDPIGRELLKSHKKAETALRASAQHLRMNGLAAAAGEVSSLLDFRGEMLAAGGSTTEAAVDAAKKLGPVRFCRPDDAPHRPDGVAANVYVFGPPRDLKALGRMDPSQKNPETYGVSAMRSLLSDIAPALKALDTPGEPSEDAPFGAIWRIGLDDKAVPPFFKAFYFDPTSDWQRIDDAWLEGASALALAFDRAVNNTSLVLAIELDAGDVLLFAADAQVGNWLSWQTLEWNLPERGKITAPDLLKRTIFYKVGHHASHNATLEELGLEAMQSLAFAMISVDEQMAHKKNWGQMPFPKLLDALQKHTGDRSIRADKDIPTAAQGSVIAKGDLYYELTL